MNPTPKPSAFSFFFFDAAGDAQTFDSYDLALAAAKRESKSETVDVIVRHFPSKSRAAMVGARVNGEPVVTSYVDGES